MTPLAMTWTAWGFLWFAVSVLIGSIWCSVCLIAEKVNDRKARKRRARRGGYLGVGPYNRKRLP